MRRLVFLKTGIIQTAFFPLSENPDEVFFLAGLPTKKTVGIKRSIIGENDEK